MSLLRKQIDTSCKTSRHSKLLKYCNCKHTPQGKQLPVYVQYTPVMSKEMPLLTFLGAMLLEIVLTYESQDYTILFSRLLSIFD